MSAFGLTRPAIRRFLLQHVIFWLISIVLFTVVLIFLRGDIDIRNISLRLAVNILLTILFLAVSVYINLLWLIPVFFNRRRFLLFGVLQLANILLFIVLNFFVTFFFEGMRHPKNLTAEIVAEFILVLIFLTVSTLLKFTRDSIALQDIELKIKEVEKEKAEAELRALKAQVNPHFFFNTLNTLYSLSLDKSDKAPEMILKLSDLMRYVIYESRDDLVPLDKQLEFLRSYVFLEKLRSDTALDVRFDVEGDQTGLRIAPLIFLAFIENAFKHGAKLRSDKPYIHIRFDLRNDRSVFFSVENRIDPYREASRAGGFGLTNVKKRLGLLYPENHHLVISETREVFRVELTILAG